MEPFPISFQYGGIDYTGIVAPQFENNIPYYKVSLRNDSEEGEVIIVPRHTDTDHLTWEFLFPGEQESMENKDPDLLQAVGKAIESHEL